MQIFIAFLSLIILLLLTRTRTIQIGDSSKNISRKFRRIAVMAGVIETQTPSPVDPSSKSRNRMEIHRLNFELADSAVEPQHKKRRRVLHELDISDKRSKTDHDDASEFPRFGVTSVCGRRRDMEDAVAIRPFFCGRDSVTSGGLHFYGVFDGHGCSHVARRCKERMHEIVRDEYVNGSNSSWEETMGRSFMKMDEDVSEWSSGRASTSRCRCEMQTPQRDSVGSTAVVSVVSPEKIIVSNCGDSRALLCRNGIAVPLSVDHKPDRPDELRRIEEAGGRVIYWDGARVLGVLAMSRALGDSYLKPYVISEPEVTVTDRTAEDECLILASDGLWDVVSDQTACGVARMCLQSRKAPPPNEGAVAGESSYQACSDASILLTRLALARRSTDNVSVVVVDLRRSQ